MWLSFKNSQPCPNAHDKSIAEVLAERKTQNVDINTLNDLMLATDVKTRMFDWRSAIFQLDGGLTQPIFQCGRLMARLKAKKYKYEQMVNNYQKTILTSIQEINDSLAELKQTQIKTKTI